MNLSNDRLRLLILWGCAVLLYFVANLQKVIIPGATFNELQGHFAASAGVITGLGAVFMYTYAFSQLALGLLVDRYSGARVMAWGGLLLCGGGLLSGLSPALWVLYCARILTAVGAASIYLSVTKETSRIFPGNFALMLGIVMVFGYLGGVSGNAPFIATARYMGWEQVIFAVGIGSAVVYLLFSGLKLSLPLPPVVRTATFSYRRFFEVAKIRHNWYVIICGGFPFGLYFAVQSIFGKKFLEDFSGMNATHAGWVLTALMVIGAANSLLAPGLSRVFGNRRRVFMLFSGIGTAVAFFALVLALAFGLRTPWLSGGAFILLAFTGNISPVIVALIRETNQSDIWGVMLSLYGFLAYIVTALVGNTAGFLMGLFPPLETDGILIYSASSYLAVFGVLFVLSLAAAYCSLRIRETNGTNIAETIH